MAKKKTATKTKAPKKPKPTPKAEKSEKPPKLEKLDFLLCLSSDGDYHLTDNADKVDARDWASAKNEAGENATIHPVRILVPFPRPPKKPKLAQGLKLAAEAGKPEAWSVPDENESQKGLFADAPVVVPPVPAVSHEACEPGCMTEAAPSS